MSLRKGPRYKVYFCTKCEGRHVNTEPIFYSHIYEQSKQGGIQELSGTELSAFSEAAAIRRYKHNQERGRLNG